MKMTKALVVAVLAMAGVVTGCGGADEGSAGEDSVLPSAGVQQQLYDLESADSVDSTGCTSSQYMTVMDHCQDNHASSYTCCHITSCTQSSSGYLVYSWDGYYAC